MDNSLLEVDINAPTDTNATDPRRERPSHQFCPQLIENYVSTGTILSLDALLLFLLFDFLPPLSASSHLGSTLRDRDARPPAAEPCLALGLGMPR